MKRVVHCKRSSYDVYIGRPSKWGNPFILGRDGTREQVNALYERWLMEQPELVAALDELRGKVLGCWCHPEACHGDVLWRLANGAGSNPTTDTIAKIKTLPTPETKISVN